MEVIHCKRYRRIDFRNTSASRLSLSPLSRCLNLDSAPLDNIFDLSSISKLLFFLLKGVLFETRLELTEVLKLEML